MNTWPIATWQVSSIWLHIWLTICLLWSQAAVGHLSWHLGRPSPEVGFRAKFLDLMTLSLENVTKWGRGVILPSLIFYSGWWVWGAPKVTSAVKWYTPKWSPGQRGAEDLEHSPHCVSSPLSACGPGWAVCWWQVGMAGMVENVALKRWCLRGSDDWECGGVVLMDLPAAYWHFWLTDIYVMTFQRHVWKESVWCFVSHLCWVTDDHQGCLQQALIEACVHLKADHRASFTDTPQHSDI